MDFSPQMPMLFSQQDQTIIMNKKWAIYVSRFKPILLWNLDKTAGGELQIV